MAGEILAYASFFGLLYFKGYVFYIIVKNKDEIMNNPEYAERHNTLTYELRDNKLSMMYYPIYLAHKFLLAVFLISIKASAIGRITMIVAI